MAKRVAPKKMVMKKIAKSTPLKKGTTPLEKGKVQQPSSGSKDKLQLTKKSLAKGSKVAMSLQEKVTKALDTHDEDELKAAAELKDGLTKLEKSTIWSAHQTHLKHNTEEKAVYDQLSNLEKGNAQALWFIRKASPKFMNMKMEITGADRVTRVDEWCCYKQLCEKFGEEEAQMHVTSGRVLWREDPLTKGVWQYRDQGAVKREVSLQKGKTLKTEQEWEPTEDQENQFKSLYDSDLLGMLGMTDHIFSTDNLPVSLGKGKGKDGGKGFEIPGKGKRPKPKEDRPKTEEEQLEDAVTKCKKMRDVCNKTVSDLQLLIKSAKGTKFWSKAAQNDADNLVEELKTAGTELQQVLLKKSNNFDRLKEACLDAATQVKKTSLQMKEYKSLLHKTQSKASKNN
jgi:hypothetical protein